MRHGQRTWRGQMKTPVTISCELDNVELWSKCDVMCGHLHVIDLAVAKPAAKPVRRQQQFRWLRRCQPVLTMLCMVRQSA
jgi:hypothetical protein